MAGETDPGYGPVLKGFLGGKPRTRAELIPAGRNAVLDHVACLRSALEDL